MTINDVYYWYTLIKEVDSMKKTIIEIDVLLKEEDTLTLGHLFQGYDERFQARFGFKMSDHVEVTLEFEDHWDAQTFYTEIKHNPKYAQQYQVITHPYDVCKLMVSGAPTLFDYFGTREPNLLTLSRQNRIDFKIDFRQEFTNIVFTGEVVQGELLGRHCIVQVAQALPELTLAGMKYIGRSKAEFDSLLTRIFRVESDVIV